MEEILRHSYKLNEDVEEDFPNKPQDFVEQRRYMNEFVVKFLLITDVTNVFY